MKAAVCFFALFLHFVPCFSQQSKGDSAKMRIQFNNMIGDSALQPGAMYTNKANEQFAVRRLLYYISHITLHYDDKKAFEAVLPPRLVSEDDSLSKQLSFWAPAGKITAVSFLLGVDSITNTSSVQTGDLDPSKGMFWVWNTGYMMAKLEGTSPQSKAPGKQFSYDIGGYKTGENAARNISLSVPESVPQPALSFIVSADVLKWFSGKNEIRIAEQPMCLSPGALAMQVADNYAAMFTIEKKE